MDDNEILCCDDLLLKYHNCCNSAVKLTLQAYAKIFIQCDDFRVYAIQFVWYWQYIMMTVFWYWKFSSNC